MLLQQVLTIFVLAGTSTDGGLTGLRDLELRSPPTHSLRGRQPFKIWREDTNVLERLACLAHLIDPEKCLYQGQQRPPKPPPPPGPPTPPPETTTTTEDPTKSIEIWGTVKTYVLPPFIPNQTLPEGPIESCCWCPEDDTKICCRQETCLGQQEGEEEEEDERKK